MFKFLFLSAWFSLSYSPRAQANPELVQQRERTISVLGQAQVKVVPNRVLISMTVESRGSSLIKTQKKNDEMVKAFLLYWSDTLENREKNIQTDFFQVSPQYDYCKDSASRRTCDSSKIVSYAVRKNIQIQLDDISQYEGLINQAFALGIKRINSVRFVTTELRKYSDRARELAAKAAKKKAQAVAATLGSEIRRPLSISINNTESQYYTPSGRRSFNAIQEVSSNTSVLESSSLALGQITIDASVDVVFELK